MRNFVIFLSFQDQNLFSIDFNMEESGSEKHVFAAESKRAVVQWIEVGYLRFVRATVGRVAAYIFLGVAYCTCAHTRSLN